jgi:iron complex outermembrane receptor protein
MTIASAVVILVGSSAVAETPPPDDMSSQLQEIIVNARKRDERVIDIPESIAVILADDLTSRSVQSIEDVGRQTPNLQMNMRTDLATNVVIRGIGAYGDVLGVGFSIDNVPNFTDQTMRLEDLESVQILKGPQGTLYGGEQCWGTSPVREQEARI